MTFAVTVKSSAELAKAGADSAAMAASILPQLLTIAHDDPDDPDRIGDGVSGPLWDITALAVDACAADSGHGRAGQDRPARRPSDSPFRPGTPCPTLPAGGRLLHINTIAAGSCAPAPPPGITAAGAV